MTRWAPSWPRVTTARAAVQCLGAAAVVLVAVHEGVARADETLDRSRGEVVFDTAAQFYDVRSPSGGTVLARRRLTSTIAGRASDLVDPKYGELTFRARARFDSDFGRGGEEENPSDYGHFVPGFSRSGGDLMYAYLDARRLFVDWLAFRVGRQYLTDALGFWSFDGTWVKLGGKFPVALDLYSGFEQRGGFPLSSSRYEAGGAYRGDRRGIDSSLYPSFEETHLAPAFGMGIETAGLTAFHARATYRKVWNTGSVHPNPFGSETLALGARTSTERIGLSAETSIDMLGAARVAATYDLFRGLVDSARASIDGFATKRLTIGTDFEHFRPIFDADSIWNFFAGEPTDTLSGRVSYEISDEWSAAAGAGGRLFHSDEAKIAIDPRLAAQFPTTGTSFAAQGYAHLRHRSRTASHGLSHRFAVGEAGNRLGVDLFASRTLASRWLLDGRGSLWHFADRLREGRDATSLGLIVSVGYRVTQRTTATLEDQVEFNRLIGIRNRLVVWLTVGVDP